MAYGKPSVDDFSISWHIKKTSTSTMKNLLKERKIKNNWNFLMIHFAMRNYEKLIKPSEYYRRLIKEFLCVLVLVHLCTLAIFVYRLFLCQTYFWNSATFFFKWIIIKIEVNITIADLLLLCFGLNNVLQKVFHKTAQYKTTRNKNMWFKFNFNFNIENAFWKAVTYLHKKGYRSFDLIRLI